MVTRRGHFSKVESTIYLHVQKMHPTITINKNSCHYLTWREKNYLFILKIEKPFVSHMQYLVSAPHRKVYPPLVQPQPDVAHRVCKVEPDAGANGLGKGGDQGDVEQLAWTYERKRERD